MRSPLAAGGPHRRQSRHQFATCHAWLAGHPRSDLRKTVYHMEAFLLLIDQGY